MHDIVYILRKLRVFEREEEGVREREREMGKSYNILD